MSIEIVTTYHDPKRKKESTLDVSARIVGASITNLGADSEFETFARTKLVPLKEWCDKSKSDLVCFLDGNDTILRASPKAIADYWAAIAPDRVVIGSEVVCWPYDDLEQTLYQRYLDNGGGRMAFIDTGLILGRPKHVSEMLNVVIESIPKFRKKMPCVTERILEDDVGLFALNVCAGSIDPWIDYNNQFIMALKNVDLSVVDLDSTLVLHCNGHRRRDRNKLHELSAKYLGKKVDKRDKVGY